VGWWVAFEVDWFSLVGGHNVIVSDMQNIFILMEASLAVAYYLFYIYC